MVRTLFFNALARPKDIGMSWLAPDSPPNSQERGSNKGEIIEVLREWARFFKALLNAPTQHA
jgi:hypothetical protein